MDTPLCPLCDQVNSHSGHQDSRLIHEFPHSILFVGPHQRFPGYCVLVSRKHFREPFEVLSPAREEIFTELMTAAQAIHQAFKPWKMNYGSYGNQVPHLHWHLFPRYEGDPLLKEVPWAQSAEFAHHTTTEARAREVASRVRAEIERLSRG